MKIAFLHNIAFTHNIMTDKKMSLRAGLYYILHGWIKGTKCSVNYKSIISILECINNNEETQAIYLTQGLISLYTQVLTEACIQPSFVSTIGKFAWLIAIMIKIQGKDNACKSNQYTQQLAFRRTVPVHVSWWCLLSQGLLFTIFLHLRSESFKESFA